MGRGKEELESVLLFGRGESLSEVVGEEEEEEWVFLPGFLEKERREMKLQTCFGLKKLTEAPLER